MTRRLLSLIFSVCILIHLIPTINIFALGDYVLSKDRFRKVIEPLAYNLRSPVTTLKVSMKLPDTTDESVLYNLNDDGTVLGCLDRGTLTIAPISTGNKVRLPENCMGFFSSVDAKEMDLRGLDTSYVKDMSFMFQLCSNVKTLNLSNFETKNVENMAFMFHYCKSLESIVVTSFDTGNVYNMSHMFANCIEISTLNLENFRTGNVLCMSSMFENCEKLKVINVDNFNTEKVYDMSNMFRNCKSIKRLCLRSFKIKENTNISGMIDDCCELGTVEIEDDILLSNIHFPGT